MLPTRADCLARDVFSHYSVTRESTEAVEDLNWLDDLMRTHEVASCVLEVFYDGGWIDYRFMLVSSAFERMTGLRGAVGRSMRRLRPTHEQFWYELFWRVVQTGEVASFDHAACALNKWFRGHAFRAGSPGAYRVVVIFEVFARSAADDGARSVAQESDAMLERFGATLAHELRGPLAPLRSGLSLVQKLAGESADLRGTLAMMNRQFSRLSCLVDDLLDVGRLGSANVRIQRLRLNLHHVVSESIEACGEEIAACRHHVSVGSRRYSRIC
jgi:signal transduction histidine kinase